jgi:predicted lipoprotein with Yx(FWY)xxD motif
MKRLIPIPIVIVAAVVAIVIAGGSDDSGNANASPPSGQAATASITTHKGKLGTYLVDGQGRALYLFEADKAGVSNCSGACLSVWPALSAGGKAPVAGGGVVASKLGVTHQQSGRPLVTYNGHPLYYYTGDQHAGDATGQGLDQFGAEWYVIAPSGNKIDEG